MSRSRIRNVFFAKVHETGGSFERALDVMHSNMGRSGFVMAARKQSPMVRGQRVKPTDMRQAASRRALRLKRWGAITDKVRNVLWARVTKKLDR